jgi:hypothetical protein
MRIKRAATANGDSGFFKVLYRHCDLLLGLGVYPDTTKPPGETQAAARNEIAE